MSEEILKALIELFALIVKQDGGMLENERSYVLAFLNKQLTHEAGDQYMELFDNLAGPVSPLKKQDESPSPSVRDSIKILNICKKINRTLNQIQKIVVLMRLYELVNSDKQFTAQRMNIINTVAEVFRIQFEEFTAIEKFIKEEDPQKLIDQSILLIKDKDGDCHNCGRIIRGFRDTLIVILQVPSADSYFIKYISDNQLYLNGLPVTQGYFYTLASGSSIRLEQSTPLYYTDIVSKFKEDHERRSLTLSATGLTCRFSDGITAVNNLSFSITEGNLLGVLGASGSGKTTLVSLLSGIQKPTEGTVNINGIDVHENTDGLEGVIGYVPQDDMLMENLTVFSNLFYAASLSFSDKTKEEITHIVDRVLNSLGLFEKRDLKVGSPLNKVISGGQRKRLNIALELIREPSILFLDEPTSGLSSRDSENVMDLLRELTLKGKIVVTVIHQPSSDIFKMFDKVIILDQEGYMAYFGNPVESIVHFKTLDAQINSSIVECPSCGNVNPEVIFQIMETRVVDEFGKYTGKRKRTPAEWNSAFNERYEPEPVGDVMEKPQSPISKPGFLRQFRIFISRDLENKSANGQYIALTLLEAPVLGFLLSYIIRYIADPSSDIYIFRENENIPIFIFMSVIVALFLGLIVSAEEIFRDRIIQKRERFLNLSRGSYLMSKVTVMAIISFVQVSLFLLVANPILGIKGLWFNYFVVLFATSLCANMIGLNISATLNSAITIYIVIPLLIIPMMVLSGAMFPFDKLNRSLGSIDKVPAIAEIMPTRWAYEALMVTQFKDNNLFSTQFTREGETLYMLEKKIRQADYQINRTGELRSAIGAALTEYLAKSIDPANQEERISRSKANQSGRMSLLRNELRKMANEYNLPEFEYLQDLTTENFNPILADSILKYIGRADKVFSGIARSTEVKRERFISENRDLYTKYMIDYRNDKLEEIVTKQYEKHKTLVYKNKIVQNVYPIYQDPEKRGFLSFRTHFFAPSKYFMGKKIDTLTFNIALVFVFSLVLYITLYIDAGNRLLKRMERIKFRKAATINVIILFFLLLYIT